jgi:hypothetical protein|uniref:Maltoporin periplasmic N-terminal extension n=1 Tax=Siphoviridae sp. ctMYJ33 TaxID=2825461 RepID=A0A8S5PB31_9CAUD|nr:MAG TPA: Maltoporin periplasmic N-terminal extension [Siphoviridae sp. ctMYJ33]
MSTFIGMGANAPKKNIEAELKSRIAELEKELETAIADKNKAEKELKKSAKNSKDKTAKETDKNKAE